jgi:hypothetical protein
MSKRAKNGGKACIFLLEPKFWPFQSSAFGGDLQKGPILEICIPYQKSSNRLQPPGFCIHVAQLTNWQRSITQEKDSAITHLALSLEGLILLYIYVPTFYSGFKMETRGLKFAFSKFMFTTLE